MPSHPIVVLTALGPPGINVTRFTPDGRAVLFVTGRDSSVWQMAADGSAVVPLLDAAALVDPQP